MEGFVLRPMAWLGFRALSRNPLVRTGDRIESVVVVLAAVVVLVAGACAGALGTMVYSARAQTYAEQAQTRHAVVATAVDDAITVTTPQTVITTVYARWRVNGVDHTADLGCDKPVKAGALLQIWIDEQGNRVAAPPPSSRAAMDAATLAVVGWLSVVLVTAGAVSAVRARTRRVRDAQWDREISCLVDDDGGYTNRMP